MHFQLQTTDHAKQTISTMPQVTINDESTPEEIKRFAVALAKFMISGEFEHPLDMTDIDVTHQREVVRQALDALKTVDSIETLHAFVRGMSGLVSLDYALISAGY